MLSDKTHKQQSRLAMFCRTGELDPLQNVKTENITHYRRLVFNNILDSLSMTYPLTKKLLKKKRWLTLIENFFASHPLQSPQIWNMPQELLTYVEIFETDLIEQHPFLPELIHFEWLELEVFMMPNILRVQKCKPEMIYLNPEIRLMRFDYPVHLKKASTIRSQDKGVYFVSIHRHPQSGSVQFTHLSIPFVDVLEQMLNAPLSNLQMGIILKKYADEKAVVSALKDFLTTGFKTGLFYQNKSDSCNIQKG